METEIPQENEHEDTADADSDWDNRILCSDGSCIGVIGADGRCKECGKEYEGPLPKTVVVDKEDKIMDQDQELAAEAGEIDAPDESPPDESPKDESPEDKSPVDDDWENRVLCSDSNCIGVIGPDGKCKECGKPME